VSKKVGEILKSPMFSEDKLEGENPMLIAICTWANAMFDYNDKVRNAKK
jgi:hypothetical protein